jgi:hypothetical protein
VLGERDARERDGQGPAKFRHIGAGTYLSGAPANP